MNSHRTQNTRPLLITRALYRVFHRVFLGGSAEERGAAIQEVYDSYEETYKRTGSRANAEKQLIRSMAEAVDEDTKFYVRWLFRLAYLVAKVAIW